MIHVYYHAYADGVWWEPLSSFLTALEGVTEPYRLTVGVVGGEGNRHVLLSHLPPGTHHTVEWGDGYEQRTLGVLFNDLPTMGLDDVVLYAHTKGAGFPLPGVSTAWRNCMTQHLIRDWEKCLELLQTHDTVGCHWLTPEMHPEQVTIPYYGGNFWWAQVDHLRKLPPPSNETRYHAEAWLGTVPPRNPANLAPGWPGAGCALH